MTDSTNSTNMSVYINFEGKSVEDLIRIRANIVQSGNEIALRAIPLIDWRLRQMAEGSETEEETESETESEATESECETESEEEDESEEESEE